MTRLVTLMCGRLRPSWSLKCVKTYDQMGHSNVGSPYRVITKRNFQNEIFGTVQYRPSKFNIILFITYSREDSMIFKKVEKVVGLQQPAGRMR